MVSFAKTTILASNVTLKTSRDERLLRPKSCYSTWGPIIELSLAFVHLFLWADRPTKCITSPSQCPSGLLEAIDAFDELTMPWKRPWWKCDAWILPTCCLSRTETKRTNSVFSYLLIPWSSAFNRKIIKTTLSLSWSILTQFSSSWLNVSTFGNCTCKTALAAT